MNAPPTHGSSGTTPIRPYWPMAWGVLFLGLFFLLEWAFAMVISGMNWPPYPAPSLCLGIVVLGIAGLDYGNAAFGLTLASLVAGLMTVRGIDGALGLGSELALQSAIIVGMLRQRRDLTRALLAATVISALYLYGGDALAMITRSADLKANLAHELEQVRTLLTQLIHAQPPSEESANIERFRSFGALQLYFYPGIFLPKLMFAIWLALAILLRITSVGRDSVANTAVFREFRLPQEWALLGILAGGYLVVDTEPWASIWLNLLFIFLLGVAVQGVALLQWFFYRTQAESPVRVLTYGVMLMTPLLYPPSAVLLLAPAVFDMVADFRNIEGRRSGDEHPDDDDDDL